MKRVWKIGLSFVSFVLPLQASWQAPYDIGVKSTSGVTGFLTMPAIQIDVAYDGFDSNQKKANLQALVFGKETIELQDLFLVSKLAKQGITSFGANDYVTLLSTTTAHFKLDEKRFSTAVQFSLTGAAFKSNAIATLEVRIPFELCEHNIISRFYGDGIAGSADGDVTNFDADSPVYFFLRNISVGSYVKEEILDPKGLQLLETHRSLGLGTIRVTGSVDLQDCFESRVNKLQAGIVGLLDIPQSDISNIVWPAKRGLGGNYFGLIGEAEIEVNKILTPYAQIEAIKSFAQRTMMRVPQQKSGLGDSRTLAMHGLKASKDMNGVIVQQPYSEYDTTVPYFADKANEFERTLGSSIRLNVGNRVMLGNVCGIEMWYALHYKFADVIEASENTPQGPFNYAAVTNCTHTISHSFGMRTSYAVADDIVVHIGSLHTLRGSNAPRYTSVFASFVAAF